MNKFFWISSVVLAACSSTVPQLATAESGVIFTYPIDSQLDVPLGTRVVVTFSDPVVASALGDCTATSGAFCVVGPNGPVDGAAEVIDGSSVQFTSAALEPGTTYEVVVRSALSPNASNLPESGPLFKFTTRADRPRAAAPSLVAINGGPAATPDSFRPMLDSSTIRLVFSEPLDPRTVALKSGAFELVESATRTPVPATLIAQGIHVSIDPIDDLVPGASYELRVGSAVTDLGGRAIAATSFALTPVDSGADAPIEQVLRTRQADDPGPAKSRSGAERNVIVIDKPLIGRETSAVLPATLRAELGDPKALDEAGDAIAFTLRRGQRLALSGLEMKLGGEIPTGLSTGDIQIELLTDAGGRMYRNPYQPADQRPENQRSPLYVDLSMDLAIYALDPLGNAVLAQTVLGVQATGTAIATDGVLALETVGSMEMSILGATQAPTNLVLELVTDASATPAADTTAPELVAMEPAERSNVHNVGDAIELVFSEPVDIDRLRANGLRLETSTGQVIPTVIESHGSTIALRPVQQLAYSKNFNVVLVDVADLAGNRLATMAPLQFSTPQLVGTATPMTMVAVHPGVPCSLTGGSTSTAGRCAGGSVNDELYHPFTLAANESVEALYNQPVDPDTVVLGSSCNTGTVRVEQVETNGACKATVPGTLIKRERGFAFIPDVPWSVGTRYRLSLVTGGNDRCDANELCSLLAGDAANFDPLGGSATGDGGGPNMVIDFVGSEPTKAVFLFTEVGPFSDTNGSGFFEGNEVVRDENRAAMRIVGTTGAVGSASFAMADCIPSTPQIEGCMYISGAMPAELGELETDCELPDGTIAATCLPVGLAAQTMLGTSLSLDASVGLTINTQTGTSVLRIREPEDGQVKGFIVDDGGAPKMVLALDLYMDAPDMAIPLSEHDLHSKPLALSLEGPVSFRPDGRIAIELANTADVPVDVGISAPLGIGGSVRMVLPRGEMKLQLLSRPLRGVQP